MTNNRWLAAYAVATFLAFPHPIAGVVLDLGSLLAWVAPGCLWLGLRGAGPKQAAKRAGLASLVAHTAVLHWIWIVTVVYGHAHPVLGLAGPLGLGAYIACFGAAFGAIAAAGRFRSPFAFAVAWTALEHFRSFALTGFPWATLGYAQHHNPALVGLAPWTGVYGLSFVSVLGGVALAQWLAARRDGAAIPPGVRAAGGAAAAALLVGGLGAFTTPPDGEERLRVAVVQGNIDQGAKWSREWFARTLEIYEGLTRQAAEAGAEVVVWPETAVPGAIGTDPRQSGRFERLADETGAQLVIGAVGLEARAGGGRDVFDSAFLVAPGEGLQDRYDKTHLVPFGEYVPLAALVGKFFQAVARGIADTAVTPGRTPRAVRVFGPRGDVPVGVPICYELLFPDLMRRFVADGAQALFAITNDAWYGRTGAPYQFLAITALRSAETRVWTARAANTGVSAIIDARGRVRERTAIFGRDWLVADVPLRPAPAGGTFYTRYGDVFAWGCWIATALAFVRGRGARTEQENTSDE